MRCKLCGANGFKEPLEKHHCLRGVNRKKADKYGLYVYLCRDTCHKFGENAAHVNPATRRQLEQWAQRKAMAENNWTIADFVREFGRNYLDEEWDW